MSADPFHPILQVLAIQTESKEVDVQLRVLQAVPLLMTPPHFQMSSAMLAQVLTICLRYYGVSDPIIHHTADATLRQVVTLLFERVERVSNEGHDEAGAGGESNPSATAAGLLFKVGGCVAVVACGRVKHHSPAMLLQLQDMCLVCAGDNAEWLKHKDVKLTPCLAFELMEELIGSQVTLFHTNADLKLLVRSFVCTHTHSHTHS